MVASVSRKKRIIILALLLSICTLSISAQVVINEIKVRPNLDANTPPNGLIYVGSKEYIELYNTSCSPVNVAGYFIAMRTQPFSTLIQGGTMRIPNVPKAIIPAKSHIVIAPPDAAPSADIDIVITASTFPYCTYGGSGRFSIVNVDGWIALYDASGNPVDGMYWTSDPGNITTLSDFQGSLCLPAGSSVTTLPNVIDIYNSSPNKMIYVGGNFISDSILVRQQDGTGNWVRNLPSSITKSSASGNCNGGTCDAQTVPTFDPIGPLCLNSTAPALPAQSTNGVSGTWNPATISTSTAGTNSYTFTPTPSGGCPASPVTINVEVTSSVTPLFNSIDPLCLNSTAPLLPSQSTNGVGGTWNPATISTATVGTSTYTFTPNATGACAASPVTLNIEVKSSVTPTFDQKGPFCKDAPLIQPILPETSNNGINGKWNPASLSTAVAGNIVYTFTPASGECAIATTMTVLVENNNASATLESNAGTDNQTVTVNTPIKPIKYGFSPAAGAPGVIVTVTGLPDGVTYSFPVPGATSLEISGSPKSSVGSPFTYTLTVKGNCEPITITGTIKVLEPAPQNSFSFNCAKDTIINCLNTCITLKSRIPDIHSSSTSYDINPIALPGNCYPVSAIPNTPGTPVDLKIDDDYSGVINLPFSFPFFDDAGSPYNSLVVSPNGYISFDVTKANTESHYGILNDGIGLSGLNGTEEDLPSALYDRSLIMGAYQDIDLSTSNSPNKRIKYEVVGTAPHRKFVVTYFKAPLFYDPFFNPSCPNLIENTHQIVLYEGTGIVEVIINSLESCLEWNKGKTMTGLQNFNRNKAVIPPGRKASDPVWGSVNMNESWRFVPSAGPTLYRSVELYDLSGNLVATGDTTRIDKSTFEVSFPNVCPNGNATYVVKSKYEQINNPGNFVFGTDTINVISNDGLNVSTRKDTTICLGATVKLESISNGDTYSWSGDGLDNATLLSPVATPVNLGDNTYTLSSTKSGCTKTASVKVTVKSSVLVNAGQNQSIISGQTAQLSATASGADTYLWTSSPAGTTLSSTNILNPVASPTETTTYTLTASSSAGCKASADVTVTVVPYCIKVENAFTPNGDGINELWKVYQSFDCLSNVKASVFNRYGTKVFESKDYRNLWDGRYGGKPVPDGTYYAVIEFNLINGKTIITKTDLTIVR